MFLLVFQQAAGPFGRAKLGGELAGDSVGRVRVGINPVDRVPMHVGQVVILVEDVDEGLPVAGEFPGPAPGRRQAVERPGGVDRSEIAQPIVERWRARLEADEGEAQPLVGMEADQAMIGFVEPLGGFHAGRGGQRAVEPVEPGMKRAADALDVAAPLN